MAFEKAVAEETRLFKERGFIDTPAGRFWASWSTPEHRAAAARKERAR